MKTITKQKPFNHRDWEVRAMLAGRKTELRRVCNPQPPEESFLGPEMYSPTVVRNGMEVPGKPVFGIYGKDGDWGIKSPFGNIGDEFWVRETFQPFLSDDAMTEYGDPIHENIDYATGKGYRISYVATDGILEWGNEDGDDSTACKPSTQMPQWASRFSFRVTSQRFEQVQEITEKSILAEGFVRGKTIGGYKGFGFPEWDTEFFRMSPQDARERLWDIDNKKPEFKWTANPFEFTAGIEVLK